MYEFSRRGRLCNCKLQICEFLVLDLCISDICNLRRQQVTQHSCGVTSSNERSNVSGLKRKVVTRWRGSFLFFRNSHIRWKYVASTLAMVRQTAFTWPVENYQVYHDWRRYFIDCEVKASCSHRRRAYPCLPSSCFYFSLSVFRSSGACFTATSSWCASACLSSDLRTTSLFLQRTWSWLCSTPYYQVISIPPFAAAAELSDVQM